MDIDPPTNQWTWILKGVEKIKNILPIKNIKIEIKHENEKRNIRIQKGKSKARRSVFKQHDHTEKDVIKKGILENKFISVVLFLQFSFFC